jgi:ribosomal protein S27AE
MTDTSDDFPTGMTSGIISHKKNPYGCEARGMPCPRCEESTFIVKGNSGKCTKCGYQMTIPPNFGKGG